MALGSWIQGPLRVPTKNLWTKIITICVPRCGHQSPSFTLWKLSNAGGVVGVQKPGVKKTSFFPWKDWNCFFLQMFPGIFFMWYVGSCVVRAQKYSSGRLKFYWAWRAPWHHESKKGTFKHLIPDVLWRIHEIAWNQQTATNKNSTLTPRTDQAVFWSAVPPASWLERSGFSCRKNRLGCQVCVMRLGELLVNKSIIFHVAMWLYIYI